MLYPVIVLTTAAIGSAYLWYVKPGVVLKLMMRLNLYRSGLRVKYVQGEHYRYCYAERGNKQVSRPTLLFIHGFSASKDMFVPIVQRLSADTHIIVADLPGHGDSTTPADHHDISIQQLCDNLHEFVKLTCLSKEPFHLAGTSLGGVLSTVYAAAYPEHLALLTLICPALKTPISTDFFEEMKAGQKDHRLLPNNTDELRRMLESCFHNKKLIPKNAQIIKGVMQIRAPKNPFYRRLSDTLTRSLEEEERYADLEKQTARITCPTQVVWGKQDELIHVSGAAYLRALLPCVTRVDLFDNCGHSVCFERPGQLTKVLLTFREENVQSAERPAVPSAAL